MMKRALFIFRRDLRIQDNLGLFFALDHFDEVVLAFIFTPEQIKTNPYKSIRALQFMIESLEDLEAEILKKGGRLYLFLGKPEEVVEKTIQELKVQAVVVNRDYTPYSIARDHKIEKVCSEHGVSFHSCEDLLLYPVEESVKQDGSAYTVFTPFYRRMGKLEVPPPQTKRTFSFASFPIAFSNSHSLYKEILPVRLEQQKGGRAACLTILHKLGSFSHYAVERDFPAKEATTHLSPHLKFTTCSIREIYYAMKDHLGEGSELIRALYWREFFTLISFHFPHVFGSAFRKQFNHLPWQDSKNFALWCQGNTGVPIVDAGMRQLQETGFMHNRVRMITASFLVKDLHIDWQLGERFFAQQLIDYDPAVNNGNWQWVASTGCDAQPYFRIFNPWTQGKRFDPDCVYIKRWVKELSALSPKEIHGWETASEYVESSYPPPIVNHQEEAKKSLDYYRKAADLKR